MSTNLFHLRRTPPPSPVSNPSPVFSLTTTLRTCLFVLSAFFCLAQMGWGSWQYSGNTADGNFTYTASYDLVAGGAYEGTASITGYTGSVSSIVIPLAVSFTANPNGQNVTVDCTVVSIGDNAFFNCTSLENVQAEHCPE